LVNRLNSFDGCLHASGMANHIRIGVIEYDQIKFFGYEFLTEHIRNLYCTHFRLEVISGNFGARDKDPLFPFIGFFYTAIEKIGHMRVFLCLGNA
jgi:hypothetical protein